MGQYYKAVVATKDYGAKDTAVFSPGVYKQFRKLLEHGWMGNKFCLEVERYIYEHGICRVGWMGDYGDAFEDELDEKHKECSYIPKCNEVFCYDSPSPLKEIRKPLYDGTFDYLGKFLCNHTQKKFIDIAKFYEKNRAKAPWSNAVMCLDPLPILTAIGNGQGGGDYYDPNGESFAWAWDEISIEDEKPAGMEEYNLLLPFDEA